MAAKPTKELAAARQATGECKLAPVDPDTQRTCLLVDGETQRRAMEALRRQQHRDAVTQGLAEMEAGEGIPVEEARKLARERLLAREQ